MLPADTQYKSYDDIKDEIVSAQKIVRISVA